jgi:outer membrane protein OmpA-like peptidoglycan-associated protein
MKTLRTVILSSALLAMAGCAQSDGPFRVLRKPVTVAPAACKAVQTSIYFDRDSAALTREARTALGNASAQAKDCVVRSVRVVGLADALGAPAANLALSRRRAEAVSETLARFGFNKVEVDLAAVGDADSVAASGAAVPLRRRADVLFDLAPR